MELQTKTQTLEATTPNPARTLDEEDRGAVLPEGLGRIPLERKTTPAAAEDAIALLRRPLSQRAKMKTSPLRRKESPERSPMKK
uniref:Uncharacterized protein n=1 Tax=Picea sitchensis TaxID=3332 RepID=A9NYP2_PICSI|nr:unknown [Picea sitchensis]